MWVETKAGAMECLWAVVWEKKRVVMMEIWTAVWLVEV
jgi:hypothetical protein